MFLSTWSSASPRWRSRASRSGPSMSRCKSRRECRPSPSSACPTRQFGSARARALGADRLRAGAAGAPHHHQSRARRSAQGGQPLRSADRARADGGDRRHSARRAVGLRRAGRTRPRRLDCAGRRRPAGRHRRQCPRRGPDLSGGVRPGSRLGEPGDRDHRGVLAHPARQPFQGHAGAVAAAAENPRSRRAPSSISPTSRARKAPSARSKWRPPAGTIC